MWYNAIMIRLLRSPLHPLLSKNTLLLSYTGRKSQRRYTVPVNYVRHGDRLWITSFRQRTWWRNLRGGQAVTVRLQGRDLPAAAMVVETDEAVAEQLAAYLRLVPGQARYFQVGLDEQGQPEPAGVAEAAKSRVMIELQLVEGVVSQQASLVVSSGGE